jgi:RNA polymerase sigma-70 factor, ECF subfamily
MSFLPEVGLSETFGPFAFFRENFGFIPNIYRAQTLLPRAIEAEAQIAGAVLLKEYGLSRRQKECILLAIAAAKRNTYCVTAHWEMLCSLGMTERQVRQMVLDHHRADLPEADVAILDFGLMLSQQPTGVGWEDIEVLRQHGFADEHILEVVLVTALTEFLCTLSVGLGVAPDFKPRKGFSTTTTAPRHATLVRADPPGMHMHERSVPYLQAVNVSAETFAPFAFFRQKFGFIPNIFRAQTLRPDVLEAEAYMVGTVLLSDDILSRVQKEYILLVISAANLNTYCVAVHCEMLRALGVHEHTSDQIAVDHHHAGLSKADTALLDVAMKLSQQPMAFRRKDMDVPRKHGFSAEQILECVVMTALTTYLNTLQMGLGTVPDFEPKRVFEVGAGHAPLDLEPPSQAGQEDAATLLVARVRGGDVNAFEELVHHYHGRIYHTLIGITEDREDAEDGTQNVFLKAFSRIDQFQGASKFSTWLTRIAINEALERLRARKKRQSLFEDGPEELDEFRPRQVEAWHDNPERLYSQKQLRELVEKELMKLPAGYRVVVLLRDIEQLSTEEAAATLGLGIATLKTRLLRGRLMLREALAPHFLDRGERSACV